VRISVWKEHDVPWRQLDIRLAFQTAPGAPHMLIYHFVVDGSARVGPGDGDRQME
jgi:hypothetical protein